jgi:hypothetical protein
MANLRFSKMSSADKAEKIIRDIETIIRREEARNPAYVDLDALQAAFHTLATHQMGSLFHQGQHLTELAAGSCSKVCG